MAHLVLMAVVVLAAVALGAGCAHSQSPVLYPNAKLKEAGKAQVEAEISACRSLADDYTSSGAAIAKEVGDGAAKSVGPSPVYKGLVDRCLRERGYEVIGWQ